VTAQRALVVLRTRGLLAMALTALPSDCLLACLARVPYADLRNGIPSTCKSLRDAATSPALRKTREAAGWTEWAVFAGRYAVRTDGFIITASGARRTAPRPHIRGEFAMRASLSSGQDEVLLMEGEELMRTCAYDPRRNRWREISPLVVVRDEAVGAALGSSIMVLGGTSERSFHVYDSAQDTWSQQPQLPFGISYPQSIEVAGRLWCYASVDHLQETFIYDPESLSWTAGPRLPFELIDRGGVPWHAGAFEVHGKFCIMAYFELTPGTVKYSAFVWDPARETWDEAPFPVPPVVSWCSQIDGHLIVSGKHPSDWNIDRPSSPLTRLYVLSPGSTEWTQWRLPDGVARATRIAAVRIG
jgi:hypothetical protein